MPVIPALERIKSMKLKSEKIFESIDDAFANQDFDYFNFRDLIERLTQMFSRINSGTVSILDGKWGSGKTTFCKAWMNHLNKEGYPALYFDVFSTDINASPYEALSGAIIRRAQELKADGTPGFRKFINAAAKVGKKIAGPATNVALRAASMGVVDGDSLKAAGEIGKSIVDQLADESEEAVKRLLDAQAKSMEDVIAFKSALASLPKLLMPKNSDESQKPLIFIVDELDRCRPDFALGLMEILKHLFDVKNIHFVISTNVTQLERSVNHRYGIGDFSSQYLEKFYDFTITSVQVMAKKVDGASVDLLTNWLMIYSSAIWKCAKISLAI